MGSFEAPRLRIACVGGGPTGLYFSILMKLASPASNVTNSRLRSGAQRTEAHRLSRSRKSRGHRKPRSPESGCGRRHYPRGGRLTYSGGRARAIPGTAPLMRR